MSPQHTQDRTSEPKAFNAATHGLRGIASLMVLFAHMTGGMAEHVYASNTAYVEGIVPYWNFGTFGVDLFFVISGFVILPSALRYTWREFAARRFMRLYPLFFALSLVFIAVNALTHIQPEANDPFTIAIALTFLDLFTSTEQLTPNAWSLTFEVWFYIFTALGVYAILRRPTLLARGVLVAAVAAFLAYYPITSYFIAGLCVRLAYDRWDGLRSGRHWLAEAAMLGTCVFLASLGHYNYDWIEFRNPVLTLLILATAGYFALAVSRNSLTTRIVSHRAILYFGTISYSLYLVHPYIYYAMRLVFVRAGLFTTDVASSAVLFMAATVLAVIPVTHLVHVLFERWPYEWAYGERVLGRPTRLPGLRRRARAAA
ncbi:acyltransferase [Aureimonas sp. AU22]|uniref:acyltransferase family protein n=1 Tax=Aureimonas sp. AU22 TaxID=1638162 RepID=UPI0007863EEF|nr:acyltransferase [Aureimonas sp. AU22]